MEIFPFLLQLAALVCFLFAAFGWFATPKVQWGWLGAFLTVLSLMVTVLQLHPIH